MTAQLYYRIGKQLFRYFWVLPARHIAAAVRAIGDRGGKGPWFPEAGMESRHLLRALRG
ncbi:MAG: hypothetical protein HY360_26345 [Verrucomicrobia bacterium]|nr:hypothetical protein [Verrucomicrobiota bacterium]